ncbi:MAG: hypothetical protein ACE5EA_00685 [Nitrospirota bacterium]
MDKDIPSEKKVVIHYKDGNIKKGLLHDFSEESDKIRIDIEKDEEGVETLDIFLSDLKAIYYVKSHEGKKEYREKKKFGLIEPKGKRVMVHFKDGEVICGFCNLDDIQNNTGSINFSSLKNFFIFPSDPDANNIKIFIMASSVGDIRRL